MILDKTVKIRTNGKSIKYYRDLGYDCGYNTEIEVKIEHLLKSSNVGINVSCDYCGKELHDIKYYSYNSTIEKTGSYVCTDCTPIKRKNTFLEKYGVEHICYLEDVINKKKQTNLKKYGVEFPLQSNKIKEKIKETNIKKYGAPNPSQNEEIKNKIKKTNIEKYGHEHPMRSKMVQERQRQTLLENYGVESPMKSEVIRDKASNTCLDRYGVRNPSQSTQIRESTSNTLYENGTQMTSKQQLYLNNLYDGELNYPIKQYNADICLLNERVIVEYDGGGHMLNVATGRETLDEYNRKTIIRDKTVKQAGYKQIRIISSKDYLPSDKILLQMLDQAKEYFNTTNHTWIEYNIDSSTVRNAENKEGVYYKYGELRKIKKVS